MPHRNAALHENGRRFEHRELDDELRLAALCDAAKVGIADIEAGNFRSFSSADMLGQHLARLTSEVIGAQSVAMLEKSAYLSPATSS